jgi:transmembrane sensor
MEPKEMEFLFDRYISGKATEKEIVRLLSMAASEQYQFLLRRLVEEEILSEDFSDPLLKKRTASITKETEQRLRQRIFEAVHIPIKQSRSNLWVKLAFIASIILITLGGYFYYNTSGGLLFWEKGKSTADIAPGGNYATLSLEDGRNFQLDEMGKGTVVSLDGITIEKKGDGELTFVESPATTNKNAQISYTTIKTPKGGIYKLVLEDNSYVYLNSGSSIKLPTRFAGERRVELNGEAYFEVSHDNKKPFIVHTQDQNIRVLGTKFNVKAYSDEPVATTLADGKVRVTGTGKQEAILTPGKQAISENNKLTVREVNVGDYIGWKDNQFVFHRMSLAEIMKQLERWYDIKVDYETLPQNVYFYADISRKRNLSEVFEMLERTSDLKFEIKKERRVSITIQH